MMVKLVEKINEKFLYHFYKREFLTQEKIII